ncbi:MAG: hypothetical protein ACJ780_13590 [Solirubrobacteraceae bacterium]
MRSEAAITVQRPLEEVERLWRDPQLHAGTDRPALSDVRFVKAPGDHGTEIHVAVQRSGGKLGPTVQKLTGRDPLAKAKDDLRRFKQRVETGVLAQSEASPEGELAERKLKERPAQPLSSTEREKVGV